MTDLEGRHQAVTAMQTSIYESTTQYLDRDVLGKAFDAGMRVVQRANPAPVIETANGAVDIEPNPAHHTTRRIAELEKSLNQTKRRVADMDRDLMPMAGDKGRVARLELGLSDLRIEVDVLREMQYKMGCDFYTPITPPQPTPPAAPDEDALWEQVVSAWARAMGNNHPHPVDARGVRADVYAAKAAVAKAEELDLVPSRKIEVEGQKNP